jgi:hypothetical protein
MRYKCTNKYCCLTSTYCACQLMPWDIRFAGKWATTSFNEKEHRAVEISVRSSSVIRIFIHAGIHRTRMKCWMSFCHQVSFVLACPSRGTLVTTWYHHLWSTSGHMTYGTWDIVVVQTAGIYASRVCLIFSTMYSWTIILETWLVFFINRVTCQAHIIRSTTSLVISRSSDITYKIYRKFSNFYSNITLILILCHTSVDWSQTFTHEIWRLVALVLKRRQSNGWFQLSTYTFWSGQEERNTSLQLERAS